MKNYELAALIAAAILLVLVVYLVSAKGEKRRLALVNAEGERLPIDAEIATDSATKMKGLMGRQSLGENEGMLFVFDRPGIYPFWMLNTTIALDAIHIAENGTVVDVLQMEPCGLNVTRCKLYFPREKAKYVLEVNKGFSKDNSIIPGKSSLDLSTLKSGN
ncbi:MAG: DUF192 domain-containing protein [Candidatus Micrarchaeota archaeon]